MTLYLVRHAHAGQGDPNDPDDALRPLSRRGQQQSDRLARACGLLGVRFDRLFSSPYTRAAETAAPLQLHTQGGRLEALDALTRDDPAQLLDALQPMLIQGDSVLCLVGHEPHLSGLLSYLRCGDPGQLRIHFRKGMLVQLSGPLTAGQMELQSALTPGHLEQLGS